MKKKIILLLVSILTSGMAQGISIIAIPWYFTYELNQPSLFALGYGIITFIGFFWSIYSGTMIDSLNRKKILLGINLFNAVFFLLTSILMLLFEFKSRFLIFGAFGFCCFYYMIFFPNLYALAQELTSNKDYIKINSFIEIESQAISILAALSCGLLLSDSNPLINTIKNELFNFNRWTIEQVFLLNGLFYLISFIILMPMKYSKKIINTVPKNIGFLASFKDAVGFLKRQKDIVIYGICSQIIFAFLIVELFTLLPVFVKNCLNQNLIIFSLADVTYCVGAIISGLITAKILKKIEKIDFTIILIIISAYSFFLMSIFPKLNIFFVASLIIGLTNASVRITRMTYFFEKVPNHLIGRTNTIFNSINTIIRNILIFIFSISWFSEGQNVVFGYLIGVSVLIIFVIPLLLLQLKKIKT